MERDRKTLELIADLEKDLGKKKAAMYWTRIANYMLLAIRDDLNDMIQEQVTDTDNALAELLEETE